MLAVRPTLVGPLSATLAVLCFSINDTVIKFLSGDYALHQIVLIRSTLALAILLPIALPLAGGVRALRTERLGLHAVRGLCIVFANMTFFLGLAALPLADAVAIFFIMPLLVAVLSVVVLREHVGPHRWAAIALGFVGVLLMVRPGSESFQLAALLPIAAAFGYAGMTLLTRHIGKTEGSLALSFYIQVTFILVSCAFGLTVGDGRFAGTGSVSLDFLLRAWTWPSAGDWLLLLALATANAVAGIAISHAYRVSEAALVAPFEYIALPLSLFWGFLIFGDWPLPIALIGMSLILASGLYMIWREARQSRPPEEEMPRYRR